MNTRYIYIIILFINVGLMLGVKANSLETVLSLTSSSTPTLPTAPTTCNYTNVTSITFNVSGGSNASDETNRYVLTNISGTIIQSNSVPTFNNLVAGDYAVYAITYETAAGVTNISSGNNIQNVTSSSSCLRFSNPYSFRLCIDPCTTGADTDGDGLSNVCDEDDDNDGILDEVELICPISEHLISNTFYSEDFGFGTNVEVNTNPNVISGNSYVGRSLSMPGTWRQTNLNGHIDGTGNTNGRYLVIYNNTSTLVYQQSNIIVTPSVVINFSARVANLEGVAASPRASLIIRDGNSNAELQRVVLSLPNSNPDIWQDIQLFFTSPSPTITLEIENLETNFSGNVLGLDEIRIAEITCDSDGDGISNHQDLDSDGDGCIDVVESGGIDTDNNGVLDGTGIDGDGKVTGGTGGYNGTTGNEIVATELYIVNPPSNLTRNNGQSASFQVTARANQATNYNNGTPLYGTLGNANAGRNFQWYNGTPGFGGVPITNGGVYSGAAAATLNISEVAGLNGTQYCVVVTHDDNPCIEEMRCAILSVTTNELCNDGQDNDGDGLIDCADLDCAPVIASVIPTNLTCPPNSNNGKIVITATGQGTLTYSINNEPNYQVSNIFDNLGQGLYTIRVKSSTGCTATYNASVIMLDTPNCVEICNDGIDNDGDGDIDCDDSDCVAPPTANITADND